MRRGLDTRGSLSVRFVPEAHAYELTARREVSRRLLRFRGTTPSTFSLARSLARNLSSVARACLLDEARPLAATERRSRRYSYASCLRNGEGTKPDLAKAVSVFERLASAGLREAQVRCVR